MSWGEERGDGGEEEGRGGGGALAEAKREATETAVGGLPRAGFIERTERRAPKLPRVCVVFLARQTFTRLLEHANRPRAHKKRVISRARQI